MKLSRRVIAGIIVVIVVVAAVAVAFTALNDQDKGGVRVGYLVGDLHQLSRVVANSPDAGTNGSTIFEQYGLDIKYPNPAGYANGPAIMQAFAAGTLDAAWLGAPPVILNVINSGVGVKIVAAANDEGSSIVAKEGSGITSVADLGGKTVGTPGPGSIQHLWLLYVAQQNNLKVAAAGTGSDPNTIYWTTIAPVNQEAALQSGQIQAAVGWEPYGSDSVLSNTGYVILWSGETWPNHPCCVLVVSDSFAKNHPDEVDELVAAHVASNNWIADAEANQTSENFTKLVHIAGQFSQRSDAVVESALNHTKYTYSLGGDFKSQLVNFTNQFIGLGQISTSTLNSRGYANATAFIDSLVDTQYLDRAASVQPVSS